MKPTRTRLATAAGTVILLACAAGELPARDPAPEPPRTIGGVDRHDEQLDALVPAGAVLEVLADGHEWTEGPVWVPALESVLYSDIPRNAIYRWRQGSPASLWLRPSGYTGEAPRGGESGSTSPPTCTCCGSG